MNLRYTLLVALFAATTSFAQTEFITVWETTTNNETITIPTATSGEVYNYTVDWGDGTALSTNQTTDATHPYATPGTYTVTITGTFPRIHFNLSGDITKILEVKQWGTQAWTSMENAFYGCVNLNITATDTPDLTSVSSLQDMLSLAILTTASKIGDWNVSSVTNMSNLFNGSSDFNQDISSWDVSNVTNMSGMFGSTSNFNQDISLWKVGNVTDMSGMFNFADVFNQDLSTWKVSEVTDMSFMFDNAAAFDQDLSNWDIGKVTDMSFMFDDVTLSTANYDSMLDSWGKKVVQSNVIFDGGNSKYCDLGEAGRTALQGKNWAFTDGLKDSMANCAALSIENPQQNSWTLYPNPVESRVYISGSTAPERIQVFGIDGKKHKDIQDANSLEVEQLKAGLYMVKLINEENTEVFKVIKR